MSPDETKERDDHTNERNLEMKFIRLSLIVLILLAVAVTGFLFWGHSLLNTPASHSHAQEYVEVARGSTPDEIIARLASLGVIRREWPLRLYVRLTGSGPSMKAGEYKFASPITPLEVLSKLQEGEQRLNRFTVVEGWTRWDIAEMLARIPELNLSGPQEALALMDDASLVKEIDPMAENLEGYLFPDTYSFAPDTSPKVVVESMVRRFKEVWNDLLQKHGATNDRPPREIVIIASLIETEAKLKEERPIISSVIYNRLRVGMALGIDSSVIYASKLAGKWRNDGKVYLSDIERVSPYNTRRVIGLPPGPVASPGASALESAINPAETDYLYYVREPSRNDGAHNFYSSESDFLRGVQALRRWEQERNANISKAPPVSNQP